MPRLFIVKRTSKGYVGYTIDAACFQQWVLCMNGKTSFEFSREIALEKLEGKTEILNGINRVGNELEVQV